MRLKRAAFSTKVSRWKIVGNDHSFYSMLIIFSCYRTIIKTKTRPLNIHFHLDIWFHFNFDTISIGEKYTCTPILTINFQSSNKETRTNVNFNFVYAQAILNEWYFVIFFKNNRSNNIYSVIIKMYKNSLVRLKNQKSTIEKIF